jgi:hypothetical protein
MTCTSSTPAETMPDRFQRFLDTLPWRRIAGTVRMLGIIAISFAAGGWLVSIRDQAAQLPYLERTAANHEHEQKVLGANPVALVKCERRRVRIAESNALQAVQAAQAANVPLPNLADVPPPCPPVQVPKK